MYQGVDQEVSTYKISLPTIYSRYSKPVFVCSIKSVNK